MHDPQRLLFQLAYAVLKVMHLYAVDVHVDIGQYAGIGRHAGSDWHSSME
jgi:hypothetical protein